MEDCVPEVYQQFLETPAKFLNGAKPGVFFEQYSDPKELVTWLAEYVHQDINVPDMLLNRIADLGEASAEPLMALLKDSSQLLELRMQLISLLREIDSTLPYDMYIEWISKWDGHDELTENAIESLEAADQFSDHCTEAMKRAFPRSTPQGKTALLSILSRHPGNTDMLQSAKELFEQQPDQRIYLAAILARFGSASILPVLKRAALSSETGYLLYIELRSAIESLGSEAPKRRFLEDDPEYDSLRALDDRQQESL